MNDTLRVHPTTHGRCSCGEPATTAVPLMGHDTDGGWVVELWCGRQPSAEMIAGGRAVVADLVDIADRLELALDQLAALGKQHYDELPCNPGKHNDQDGLLVAGDPLLRMFRIVQDYLGAAAVDDIGPELTEARAFAGVD